MSAKSAIRLWLDAPLRLADGLARIGLMRYGEALLAKAYDSAPYDLPLGEALAERMFEAHQRDYPLGTVERGRFLLHIIAIAFLTDRVAAAYFENLEALLQKEPRRTAPGVVVLGLGSGRSGSTTLTSLIGSVPGAKATHENPPGIFWEPHPRQLGFHLHRMEMLTRHFPVVVDSSSWWLNALDAVFVAFPNSKAVGAFRETEACLRSWMKVTIPEYNPWVAPHNGIWQTYRGDMYFPHYPVPEGARRDPEAAREGLIRRYITEYNAKMQDLARRAPNRLLLVRTEDLDALETRQKMSEFLGLELSGPSVHRNRGSKEYDATHDLRF
jgi:hypothetical protein